MRTAAPGRLMTRLAAGLCLATALCACGPRAADLGSSRDLGINLGTGADIAYLGGAKDYVFMRHDGSPDVVRCGAGKDLVQYIGKREAHDRYIGCERVKRYSPRSA